MKRLLFLLLLSLPCAVRAQAPLTTTQSVTDTAVAAVVADTLVTQSAAPATVVATAADSVPKALRGLSGAERRQLGRADARVYYLPRKSIFWTSAGLGFLTLPVLVVAPVGAVVPAAGAAVLGAVPPRKSHVEASAPHPLLLRDPDYRHGYVTRANGKKIGRAVLGWGTGSVISLGLVAGTLMALFPNGWSSGE